MTKETVCASFRITKDGIIYIGTERLECGDPVDEVYVHDNRGEE